MKPAPPVTKLLMSVQDTQSAAEPVSAAQQQAGPDRDGDGSEADATEGQDGAIAIAAPVVGVGRGCDLRLGPGRCRLRGSALGLSPSESLAAPLAPGLRFGLRLGLRFRPGLGLGPSFLASLSGGLV
jgi:hypothetical protein